MVPKKLLQFAVLVILALAGSAALPRPGSVVSAEPLIVEIPLSGNQQVPPVQTVAYGFVRFFFDESRLNADYTVDIKGLSTGSVTGAEIRRGVRGSEGPVVKHLADGGFIVTSGKLRLTRPELEEMLSGIWYVRVNSVNHPEGEIRGQITLPPNFIPGATPEPAPTAAAAPPSTGPSPALEAVTPAALVPSESPPAAVEPPVSAPQAAGQAASAPLPPAAPTLTPAGTELRITPPSTGTGGLLR